MHFLFLLVILMFDPSGAAAPGCEPCAEQDWTQFIDADDPDDEGDLERLSDHVTLSPRLVCSNPTGRDVQLVGQCSNANPVVDLSDGFACYNADNQGGCCDYKVRYCCPGLDLCDELNPGACQNGARCVGNAGSYECVCEPGFTGEHCDLDVNECLEMPGACHENATCTNTVGSFVCSCNEFYTGDGFVCDADFCNQSPGVCGSNGRCEDTETGYNCVCDEGYSGTHCEVRDFCAPNPCLNNGSCASFSWGFDCTCSFWYGGDTCETGLKTRPTLSEFSWTEARSFCQSKGGDLVARHMRNATGRQLVRDQIGQRIYWIGLSDRAKEGEWVYVDGVESTADNSDFLPGAPDDDGLFEIGADCAAMIAAHDHRFDDIECSYEYRAICEKSL